MAYNIMVTFSEQILSEFRLNADAGATIEDDACEGFVARKNINGSVSLIKLINVHGKLRQFTLGKFEENSLEEMRTKASTMTDDKFVSYR